MTTVNFTYNLPEDHTEMMLAVHALDWAIVCYDLAQHLRKLMKYEAEGHDVPTLEYVHEQLYNIMEENEVSFNMIP